MVKANLIQETPLTFRWMNYQTRRYYAAYLFMDLLGTWKLMKIWGASHNNLGRKVEIVCPDFLTGISLLNELINKRKQRKYKLLKKQSDIKLFTKINNQLSKLNKSGFNYSTLGTPFPHKKVENRLGV